MHITCFKKWMFSLQNCFVFQGAGRGLTRHEQKALGSVNTQQFEQPALALREMTPGLNSSHSGQNLLDTRWGGGGVRREKMNICMNKERKCMKYTWVPETIIWIDASLNFSWPSSHFHWASPRISPWWSWPYPNFAVRARVTTPRKLNLGWGVKK